MMVMGKSSVGVRDDCGIGARDDCGIGARDDCGIGARDDCGIGARDDCGIGVVNGTDVGNIPVEAGIAGAVAGVVERLGSTGPKKKVVPRVGTEAVLKITSGITPRVDSMFTSGIGVGVGIKSVAIVDTGNVSKISAFRGDSC
jgi:hypothetical protein